MSLLKILPHSDVLLKLLFTRRWHRVRGLINSTLSPEISLQSRLPSFSSQLCFQGQTQCLPFFPSFLLQSSCHLPCTNCAHVPAGFRCKSYLNLSPAATHTEREMEENRPPGYCCNLQNEHEFALWDIRARMWATSWHKGEFVCIPITISLISLPKLEYCYNPVGLNYVWDKPAGLRWHSTEHIWPLALTLPHNSCSFCSNVCCLLVNQRPASVLLRGPHCPLLCLTRKWSEQHRI